MQNNVVITVFDIEERKQRLREELKQKGSVEMLHFKGGTYRVFAIIRHTETKEEMVAYKCIKSDYLTEEEMGTFWARPIDMFLSPTDLDKYPQCQFDFRFMFVDDAKREMYELLNGQGN